MFLPCKPKKLAGYKDIIPAWYVVIKAKKSLQLFAHACR